MSSYTFLGAPPLLLGVLLPLHPSEVSAQGEPAATHVGVTSPNSAERAHPHISPTRVDTSLSLDGHLDDPIWADAARIHAFVQERPIESAPATEATEVLLAYDSQQMYIGIRAHYTDTSLVRANRVGRDQIARDDTVTVLFDPFLDQQRGYAFSVNGYGVQGDSLFSGAGGGGGDVDFHAVRYGAGFAVNTSRKVSMSGFTNWGDQIRYLTNPYLGKGRNGNLSLAVRPSPRLQSELTITTSSFTDVRSGTDEFTIRIYRLLTTYQFSERLLLRNITDHNNNDGTLGGNLLLTYRVNSGPRSSWDSTIATARRTRSMPPCTARRNTRVPTARCSQSSNTCSGTDLPMRHVHRFSALLPAGAAGVPPARARACA